MNYALNQRVGGGCGGGRPIIGRPKDINRADIYADLMAKAEERARKHREFLASPEGQAALKAEAEAAAERLQIKQAKDEENERKDAHWRLCDELRRTRHVGMILDPKEYQIHIEVGNDLNLMCYVLMVVEGDYPTPPAVTLAKTGRFGLKVFLNKDSVNQVREAWPNVFQSVDEIIKREERIRNREVEVDEYEYADTRSNKIVNEIVPGSKPIRIMGYSKSGKSAQGRFDVPRSITGSAKGPEVSTGSPDLSNDKGEGGVGH